MKKLLTSIILAIMAFGAVNAQDKYFPYPTVPDDLPTLSARCNYYIFHFWDRCNFKTAFSSHAKLNQAVGDFFSLMPYASADTVHLAIDNLLVQVKKSPQNTLTLAKMAEGWVYSDTSKLRSEEIYYPFVKSVTQNKKIPAADRARFDAQEKILSSTQKGMIVPDLKFNTPAGGTSSLRQVSGPYILLFFNDPDCSDCTLAKVRLSADININQLIKSGDLTLLSIYPGEADTEWLAAVTDYPSSWVVGACSDADAYFNLPETPRFYLLDSEKKIIGKDLLLDNVLNAFRIIAQQKQLQQQSADQNQEQNQ
jgi:hypothetical protein